MIDLFGELGMVALADGGYRDLDEADAAPPHASDRGERKQRTRQERRRECVPVFRQLCLRQLLRSADERSGDRSSRLVELQRLSTEDLRLGGVPFLS